MNRNGLPWLLALSLFAMTLVGADSSFAADGKAAIRKGEPDHPLGLVAFASIDRVKARAESLAAALGRTGEGDSILSNMLGDDESALKLMNSPGLDTTRPIGAMCFPKWFGGAVEGGDKDDVEEPNVDLSSFTDDPFSTLVEGSARMFVENATLVICIPYKDRQQLMDDVAGTVAAQESLTPVDEQSGWYQVGSNADLRMGFAHNYLLLVQDDGEVKQFDRNYPDFAKLARASLGKNGFVYALYRKGLPLLVRDVMAPAFKLAFAARFQQQDGESEIQFRMRTMSSALQMQLVDLAISHVDEFRITGHVDSRTRTILIEPEIIGAKGGKLSKYFNEGKATSLFANQPTDDAIFAASVTLPLPAKDWKPTVDALDAFAQLQGKSSEANLARVFAKTIEAGQFELYTYNISWDEGLIALRHNGGAQFPEQLQDVLPKLFDRSTFELNVDAVDGIPIHRTLTTLDDSPVFTMLAIPLLALIGQELAVPEIGETGEEKEVVFNTGVGEEEQADGTKKIVRHQNKEMVPTGQNSLWLAATPRAIFLGFGSSKSGECPDWFKTQIAASLEATPGRGKSPFQVTLRQLGSTPPHELQQVVALEEVDGGTRVKQAGGDAATAATKAELASKTQENLQARANLIRDLPNAIRCEFRPTETGAKLTISLEEAYFQWFATMIRDSHEEQEIRDKLPQRPLEVAPGGVDFAVPAK